MVDHQACAADAVLDEPSSCQPLAQAKPPVLVTLPHHRHHDNSGAFNHSSSSQQLISDQAGGGAKVSVEDEERVEGGEGLSSLDGRVGRIDGGVLFGQEALKPSRLPVEEDVQLSIPSMDLVGGNDYAPAFFHPYEQQLYHHPHAAVEATNNSVTLHSQQDQHQMTLANNGHHPTASSAQLEACGGNARVMTDRNNNDHGGLLYSQLPGQAGIFHGVNVSEVLAELERERKKNAELQGRLSCLEARLGSSDNRLGAAASGENGAKKSKKRRRIEKTTEAVENEGSRKIESQPDQLPPTKEEEGVILHVTLPLEDPIQTERHDTGVTWMSREAVTPAELEKLSKDLVSDRDDSIDSDDDDDDDDEDEYELEDDEDGDGGAKKKKKSEGELQVWKAFDKGCDAQTEGLPDLKEDAGRRPSVSSGEGRQLRDGVVEKKSGRKSRKEKRKGKRGEKAFFNRTGFGSEIVTFRGPGILASYKKAPKTAFCPKEVKRIMESGVLALKNAQSHTMRKIIVFASLGIRHGCEDLYELDFSHFSVVRRGEPYKSPKDPGEHVLYDQLGGRTKMFYPNRQNPILCPVRILDEERSMRPVGPSCPTCLFLCIKYGGRTRNLPQNEYVRQRMGRNKLKSFGPLMCQMALLVHIRTGSFFFKALGITLLFMAGFPDDLVRKETKYRNLDLLQKYYRSDEHTKGEQLFHPYPTFFPPAMMIAPPHTQKTTAAAKGTGKKGPPPLLSKPSFTPVVHRYLPPLPTRSPPAIPFPGMPPPFSPPLPPISQLLPTSGTPAAGHPSPPGPPPPPPPPYGMYPPYPPIHQNGFVPMPWAPVNSYPPGPYPPPPYAFQPFPPHSSHFLPPFYGPPPYPFPPPYGPQSSLKEEKKEAEESGDSDGDSESGSSGAAKKASEKGNNKEVP